MRKNVIKGVFIAPITSGVMNGLYMSNWLAFIFAMVFAFVVTLLIGLPAFLLLERNNKVTLPYLIATGFLGGSAVGLFFIGIDFRASSILLSQLIFVSHGMLVARAF